MGEIFLNHRFDKNLFSKIYEEIIHSVAKTQTIQFIYLFSIKK